ncbi:MAG: hypothetical protein WC347_06065 [Smithellaceae bacterium]|jgi:hypothetical protein
MNQDLTKGQAKFTSFNHPLMQAQMWSMPELYEWQREIIEEAASPGARVAVSTNNESGKTRILVPLIGLSVLAAFPGATVFSTAGAEEQVRGQLFKYLAGIIRPHEGAGWSISASDLTVTAPKIRGLKSRWISRVPRDALTIEGYHGGWEKDDKGEWCWCPVCVIIDEAKSVDAAVFEAAWRIDPDFLFVISTPGEDAGPFFEAIAPDTLDGGIKHDPDGLWHYRRKISWRECPHLLTPGKLARREKLIEKYGARSSFIKSFLEGEFQRQTDENNVFTDTDLERVKLAMRPRANYNPGKKFAGLEFSGGGDEQPIMILDGDKVVYGKVWREEDTDKLAQNFLIDLRRFEVKPQNAIADNGGIGQAIIDNMESREYRGIVRYMNNQDPVSRHEYADRITEDHWRFKEMLRLHPEIQLQDDPVLMKQMRQRRFIMDDHNRVKLEPKRNHRKRTGESPDRLDTLIMTFSEWKPPKKEEKKTEYHSTIEEEARKKRGEGAQAAFGWIKKQPDMARMMVNHTQKINVK